MKASRPMIVLMALALCLQTVYGLLYPSSRQPVSKSNLIMIFPGSESRFHAGFALAQQSYAPNLAISGYTQGLVVSEAKKHPHPAGLGLLASGRSRSTFEDAYNTRQIALKHRLQSILLVTSSYHMPRASLFTRIMLLGTGIGLQTYPVQEASLLPGKRGATLLRMKLFSYELIKFWGNLTEMAYCLTSGKLLLDVPYFFQASTFFKKTILPPPPSAAQDSSRTLQNGLTNSTRPLTIALRRHTRNICPANSLNSLPG